MPTRTGVAAASTLASTATPQREGKKKKKSLRGAVGGLHGVGDGEVDELLGLRPVDQVEVVAGAVDPVFQTTCTDGESACDFARPT